MSESMRNKAAAYNRGAVSYKTHEDCPYGFTKVELRSWWHAGINDAERNCLDFSLCYDKTLKKLGIERPE